MPVLTVTADEDYRDNVPSVANTIAITFATTAISSTARFNSIQFGAAFISDTVAITGDANFNTIAVHTPSDAVFSAAGWTFTSWSAGDSIRIFGTSAAETIIGSSKSTVIFGDDGADILIGGNSDDLFAYASGTHADAGEIVNGGGGIDTISGPGNTSDFSQVTLSSIERLTNAALSTMTFSGGQIGSGAITQVDGGNTGGLALIINGASVNLSSVTFSGWTGGNSITINGTAGGNALTGSNQIDIIDGGSGADLMRGLGGSDNYIVDNAGDIVDETATGSDGIDTVFASVSFALADGVEDLKLIGTALNGTGNALANVITGDAAANILDGQAGADTMRGLGGSDNYIVDNAGDIVDETATGSDGIDTVFASVSFALADGVEDLKLIGTALNGTGNALANVITGDAAANILDGQAGADTMRGLGGSDNYIVDNAGDIVDEIAVGSSGTDTVRATFDFNLRDAVHVTGAVENLVLLGAAVTGTGNDLANAIVGNANGNTLNGDGGDDILDGGDGADIMRGLNGNDTYVVDDLLDVVDERPAGSDGIDTVLASVNITLGGGIAKFVSLAPAATGLGPVENITLTGSAVEATGNDLANVIIGNGVANRLAGGLGADQFNGGGGADSFLFFSIKDSGKKAAARDTILDLTAEDFIDLSAIDAKTGGKDNTFKFIGKQSFHDKKGELHYAKKQGDVVVSGDVNGDGKADFSILLDGLKKVVASDFVL